MGCIQSYFKRAHNAGLSPSSTQDSNSKTGGEDGCVEAANSTGTVEKDKVSADFTSGDKQPEEPESNDTSYGVEATAVRALAASTGTVAILGTTAKTPQSRRESKVSNIDKSDNEEISNKVASSSTENENNKETNADSINLEIKDEHKNASTNLVNDIKLDEVAKTVDKIESVLNKSSTDVESSAKVEASTKEVVVDVESSDKIVAVETPTKTVVVDEISTTQTTKALVEDVKVEESTTVGVNDAASPLEDGGFSENNFTSELEDEDDRPTTVLEIEKASSNTEMRTSISENSENEDNKGFDDEISSEQLKTNSLSDTTLSESYNAGLDSIKQSDGENATPVVENAEVVIEEKEISSKTEVLADNLKNGELESVVELGNKVVEENVLKKEISEIESKIVGADSKREVEEEPIVKTVATKVESAPTNRNSGADQTYSNDVEKASKSLDKVDIKDVVNKVENGLPSILPDSCVLVNNRAEVNGEVLPPESVSNKVVVDKNGEAESDKMSAAATTIQATFRGYQTRQQNAKDIVENEESNHLPQETASNVVEIKVMQLAEIVDEETEKKLESIIASKEGLIGVEEKMDAAATAIQATFRGYQTRQNIKKDDDKTKATDEVGHNDSKEKDSIDTTRVDDIVHKENDSIDTTKAHEDTKVADISQSDDAQLDKVPASVEQSKSESSKPNQVEKVKTSQESSDTSSFDSVQNGSTSIDPVTCVSIKDKSEVDKNNRLEGKENKSLSAEEVENIVGKLVDGVSKVDGLESKEKSISLEDSKQTVLDEKKESLAATTIQANFRGYQARQNLQKKEEVLEESGDKKENIKIEEDGDEKVSTAATKIQAGFRGYQTRKKLKEDEDDTVVIEALTSRTPELVESVREEVDEICKRAVETTENIISQGLHKFHKSGSVEEEEEEEGKEKRGSADKSEVAEVAKQTIEAVVENAEKIADEKMNSAATTIQASFRGFQARQNLEKITDPDGLPDFPPSTEDEDYTPVPDDDDLPLPDLEALESSYSEEVATEPLLPAPLGTSAAPLFQNLPIPETEEVSEASTEVGTIEDDLKSLQRPQECDELDRLENSSDGESSLSSAATKIQAGVRGYLTRKHNSHAQAGTTSTSGPSFLSSDRSLGDFGSSREEDGPVRSMISTEEETEIGRHRSSPEANKRIMKKRMSLDSRTMTTTPVSFSRTSRAMSVSAVREDASNEEVWEMLQSELSTAATKIQSNFRGYQARKQLRRGDAVQMPTTSSSTTPGSNSLDSSVGRTGHVADHARSSGEYHDMIALTPPNIPVLGEEEDEEKEEAEGKSTSQSNSSCSRDEDTMVKRRHENEQNNESRRQEEEGNVENSENSAAAKIQAGFRGYKVRRDMNAQDVTTTTSSQQVTNCATNVAESPTTNSNNHSSAEIEAATKIQAGFRGFKTRQELKTSKSADSK